MSLSVDSLRQQLFASRDEKYRDFHCSLVPSMREDSIIGVRTPLLRKLAKEVDIEPFLDALPHRYYEENQIHAFLLSGMKDYHRCLAEVERFLPYVDNWATCDGLRPKCFSRNMDDVLRHVQQWLAFEHEYTVRFAIGMLETFFLDAGFQAEQLQWVAKIERDEYYIKMMQAWYFATALAKQWETALPILPELPEWVRRKTIQKACESFRIPQAHKAILRTLR